MLVFYFVVKEFDEFGVFYSWVYVWVLYLFGSFDFSKFCLKYGIWYIKVEVNS